MHDTITDHLSDHLSVSLQSVTQNQTKNNQRQQKTLKWQTTSLKNSISNPVTREGRLGSQEQNRWELEEKNYKKTKNDVDDNKTMMMTMVILRR